MRQAERTSTITPIVRASADNRTLTFHVKEVRMCNWATSPSATMHIWQASFRVYFFFKWGREHRGICEGHVSTVGWLWGLSDLRWWFSRPVGENSHATCDVSSDSETLLSVVKKIESQSLERLLLPLTLRLMGSSSSFSTTPPSIFRCFSLSSPLAFFIRKLHRSG